MGLFFLNIQWISVPKHLARFTERKANIHLLMEGALNIQHNIICLSCYYIPQGLLLLWLFDVGAYIIHWLRFDWSDI